MTRPMHPHEGFTGYGAAIDRATLETFKAKWPCHGIDDKIWRVYVEWQSNGDLVDVVAFYRNGRRVADNTSYDGPAILALINDTQREMHPEHSR